MTMLHFRRSALLSLLGAALASLVALPATAAAKPSPKPGPAVSAPQADLPPPKEAPVELQAWEKRRLAYAELTRKLQSGDALARKEFEMRMRQFEKSPFDLTPLESMDIIGSVFVPQAGVEKMLPLIAAQAALGLYDAYRFSSNIGQTELTYGERFLPRPLTLAGKEQAAASRKYLQEHPQRAAELVRQGIALADGERLAPAYDPKWITALDRSREFCPPGASCPKFEPPAREEWPAIWARVVKEVTDYYQVEPEQAPAPAAPASAAR
ncbi:hypothetical protein [Pelomonas sp. BJYL3]|uniref:hypothetical protein n=1 Tax=Pelomonas sp. BJYL3 TaxID=2976697 RepID=UPI0022B51A92|nr:hypothetical protein [Pelomonas sp. BJYL3]